ncbi:hypothetical protein BHM03_00047283, partial [Ensete ventricosum]
MTCPQGTAASSQPARGCPRHTRKGRPLAASPQGAAASKGSGVNRRGGRPLAGAAVAVA